MTIGQMLGIGIVAAILIVCAILKGRANRPDQGSAVTRSQGAQPAVPSANPAVIAAITAAVNEYQKTEVGVF
jgi:hypothetical protein